MLTDFLRKIVQKMGSAFVLLIYQISSGKCFWYSAFHYKSQKQKWLCNDLDSFIQSRCCAFYIFHLVWGSFSSQIWFEVFNEKRGGTMQNYVWPVLCYIVRCALYADHTFTSVSNIFKYSFHYFLMRSSKVLSPKFFWGRKLPFWIMVAKKSIHSWLSKNLEEVSVDWPALLNFSSISFFILPVNDWLMTCHKLLAVKLRLLFIKLYDLIDGRCTLLWLQSMNCKRDIFAIIKICAHVFGYAWNNGTSVLIYCSCNFKSSILRPFNKMGPKIVVITTHDKKRCLRWECNKKSKSGRCHGVLWS